MTEGPFPPIVNPMDADRLIEEFSKLLLRPRRLPDPVWDAYAEAWERELAAIQALTDDDLRRCWDGYDGSNAPEGWSGESVHMELNRRGLGDYCAV